MNATPIRTLQEAIDADTHNWLNEIAMDGDRVMVFNSINECMKNAPLLPATDMDAAEWIKDALNNKYTLIATTKTDGDWYYWDGTIHVQDETHTIADTLTKKYVRAMDSALKIAYNEINATTLSEDDKAKCRATLTSASSYVRDAKGETGMSKLRKRISMELRRSKEYFDNDREFIVFHDGQVMLTNDLFGGLLAPDPVRPVTKKLRITPGGHDTRPGMWADLLDRLGIEPADQRYLQVAAGAALLGRGDAKNIVTLVGVSNTGKTTYAMALYKLFGGYAGTLPAGAIVDKAGTNFDQYKARGVRFLLLEEPQEKRVADDYLKNLSGGGGLVPTQEKGKNGVEWKAQCVLHITANHVPRINTKDDAIVGRLNIVPFNVVRKEEPTHIVSEDDMEDIAGNEDDNVLLMDQLVRDCPNEIFDWILEGADIYSRTSVIPKSKGIIERAQNVVVEGSAVIRWLLEQTEWTHNDTVPPRFTLNKTDVHTAMVEASMEEYNNFCMWIEFRNEERVTKKTWQQEINRFMKEPAERAGKRSGGSLRLWGVSPYTNSVQNALAPGHHNWGQYSRS